MYDLSKQDREWVEEVWNRLDKKLSKTAVTSFGKIPYTTNDGVHDNKAEEDKCWWTNGFWPALMVLMYDATKNEQYLKTARNAMDMLDDALLDYDGLHHDVGFMWNISSGADWRLNGDDRQRKRFLTAASLLMGRYNEKGRFIRAWNGDHYGWAIIDCMMNIPLLYRATEETGDFRFKMVAMSHADTTMQYHMRGDGSCNHINVYDAVDGTGFAESRTGQGYAGNPQSSWSRGQAWALYGFVLSYIYTGKKEYLDTAKNAAHYFIANVSDTDWLPLCDFRAPKKPVIYDSTAGAIAASGMLEIARNVDEFEKDLYLNAAMKILKAMEKEFCNWSETEDSILQMGTEAYDRGIHMPIIYGDYFFAEAIYKLKGFKNLMW